MSCFKQTSVYKPVFDFLEAQDIGWEGHRHFIIDTCEVLTVKSSQTTTSAQHHFSTACGKVNSLEKSITISVKDYDDNLASMGKDIMEARASSSQELLQTNIFLSTMKLHEPAFHTKLSEHITNSQTLRKLNTDVATARVHRAFWAVRKMDDEDKKAEKRAARMLGQAGDGP
jgi:hypothetical protein